ncbi:MBL fold metallo-hydrolase [Lacinutrix sp. Hel_I_90]|uniref:MBL fold metallo-hydrolase n=1 Tax=Lacinutrix sp. Hel_I_90 TaxID=1249999 RepID=UPI0005C97D0F|nr:MBL fold metallo-hydrolase [Lacinutrix sp. Hel_I_90]
MKTIKHLTLCLGLIILSCKHEKKSETVQAETPTEINLKGELEVHPISHATLVLSHDDLIVYVDPTGGSAAFMPYKEPDYVLITDIHGDHMDIETLEALNLKESLIIAPKAVFDKLPEALQSNTMVMNNGDIKEFEAFKIEAIPMYNLRKEALKFHEKGRGNGYVLTIGDERIYISGDTEDIPEMRNLTAIDKAFVCMNLPYTMTVDSAASAVLDFKPKQVYPYHYRGTEGLSDVERFKALVKEGNPDIKVVQLDWYPAN